MDGFDDFGGGGGRYDARLNRVWRAARRCHASFGGYLFLMDVELSAGRRMRFHLDEHLFSVSG